MLSERRVIHMTHMELDRKRNAATITPFINVDKKDYISFHRVIGFIVGSVFYAVIMISVATVILSLFSTDLDRMLLIVLLLGAALGYIVFLFFYQRWYFRYCLERYRDARRLINRTKRDWDILEGIYRDEAEATRPTVDMNLLFPEGSLGENE